VGELGARGAAVAAVALGLLGGCVAPPPSGEALIRPVAAPADPAAEAALLRERVVLGKALLGGSLARVSAAPAGGGVAEEGPVGRARAGAEATARRALAAQELLALWARRAEGPEPRDEPDQVRRAQRLLKALGYYEGPLNGRNGPLSSAAVRRFQAIQGLPETGAVTASLLVALRAAL
jgi:Putative peptidoglycan binding domain